MLVLLMILMVGDVPAIDPVQVVAEYDGGSINWIDIIARGYEDFNKLGERKFPNDYARKLEIQKVINFHLKGALYESLLRKESETGQTEPRALFEKEVSGKTKEPTDEEVNALLEQRTDKSVAVTDELRGQAKAYLKDRNYQEAYENYYQRLSDKYKVRIYLAPVSMNIETAGRPSSGPKNAPLKIAVFSDFECPSCAQLNEDFKTLNQRFAGKIHRVYFQFPLKTHEHAKDAARAALCAEEQGKFHEMHDALFAEPREEFTEDALLGRAIQAGLDTSLFQSCMETNATLDTVEADRALGEQFGISGTPALIINGRFYDGPKNLEAISEYLQKELADKHGS